MKFCLNRAIKTKGQAASTLNLFLAVFVIAALGAFSVELSRYLLAQDQLKASVEAAALCCETILVSSGNPTSATNQTAAEAAALNLFQQNSILGQNLSSASLVTASGQTGPQFDVGPGESQICFQFLDPITQLPINTNTLSSAPTPSNNSSSAVGAVIQATAAYSYVPFFGQFIGMGNTQFTFQSSAVSGIPLIDLVFVYDVSGGENTQTPVTYVQRYWHNPWGIDYFLPSPIGDPASQLMTGGPMNCAANPPNQGTNPTTPQNLDNGQYCSQSPLTYAELSGSATQLLTGSVQAYAAPPGNYPPPNNNIQVVQETYTNGGTSVNYYVPVPSNSSPSNAMVFPATQLVAVPVSSLPGNPSITSPFPPGGALSAVYILSSSISSLIGSNPFSSLSNYQAPLQLNNGTNISGVWFGGGSSYGAASAPMIPTGPSPTPGSNGGSPVASVLSGNTYDTYGHEFTDCIVNIDNNASFQNASVTYNGSTYNFPSLATVVEASHGNLENLAAAQGAGLNLAAMGLSSSNLQSGYYAAYVQAAMASIQPMNTVANATTAFMTQLASSANVDFGCITFNDYTGTSPTSTAPPSLQSSYFPELMQAAMAQAAIAAPAGPSNPYNIATSYPYPSINTNPDGTIGYSGTDTYLLPNITLAPQNISAIAGVLPIVHTWGNCNVAGALNAALAELDPQIVGSSAVSPARPVANKAIVIIASQAPNVGFNGDTGIAAVNDAVSMAQLAKQAGIPIYCLSVAQSSTDDANEDAAYSAIVKAAGRGNYYRVNWSNPAATQASLTSAFANIARKLVSVIPSQGGLPNQVPITTGFGQTFP